MLTCPQDSFLRCKNLEVEAEFHRFRARRNEVCAAESRQEIVKSYVISQVDYREAQAPLIVIAMKEVIKRNRQTKLVLLITFSSICPLT